MDSEQKNDRKTMGHTENHGKDCAINNKTNGHTTKSIYQLQNWENKTPLVEH